MKVYQSDGQRILKVHQSDINDFLMCPEQFRMTRGIRPHGRIDDEVIDEHRTQGDAAEVGTVLHRVIEEEWNDGPFASLSRMLDSAQEWYEEAVAGYERDGIRFLRNSFETDRAAIEQVVLLCGDWYNSDERKYWLARREQNPDSILTEYEFDMPFMGLDHVGHKFDAVHLGGTIDIVDLQENRLIDWKTGERVEYRYKRWEKQRWANQPTVYTLAAAEAGFLSSKSMGYEFQFRVFQRGGNQGEPHKVTVWRNSGHWAWLSRQVAGMVKMIESDLEMWPVVDDHVLCSPKWCPVWGACKGGWVEDDWT